jgi:hypothetical protein
MAEQWYKRLPTLGPSIFKIFTPQGSGTGFAVVRNKKGAWAIATAYHVISHANDWDEPIKLIHYTTKSIFILKGDANSRIIFPYPDKDLAIIFFTPENLTTAGDPPSLIDEGQVLKPGNEVVWFGFPSVMPDELCLFQGYISAYISSETFYLVDGTVINGVSGGPAFYVDESNGELRACGVVTNYAPNRATGEVLPGLGVVRSVETYWQKVKEIKTLDEAQEKAEKDAASGEMKS